jgi:DNA-binding beta-propeller fold protein YncE
MATGAPFKGDGPTTIAAAYGTVWVGTGNGTLLRIDARAGRITGRLLRDLGTQYGYVHGLAVGFGSVWVAQGAYETLRRVDPATNRSIEVRPRGRWTATLVAAGSGAVWVGDFERNTVFRVEPRSNRVVAGIRVPGRLWGLAAGPPGVWVVALAGRGPVKPETAREVRAVDVAANRVGRPLLRSKCDFALAVGTRSLWVSDLCTKTLTRLGRGAPPMSIPVAEASVGLAVGEGAVWVLSQAERSVRRIDPRTGRRLATLPVQGVSLAPGSGSVWVLDTGDGQVGFVRRIDPRSNRVVGAALRVDPR